MIIKKHLLVLLVWLCQALFTVAGDKYSITDYGAKGDGVTNNTKILQEVIDLCNRNGGGTVYFPSGTYISGTIFLKDHVVIDLDWGATIKGSSELKDFPDLEKNRKGLIHAVGIQHSGIIGYGTIDANGNNPVFHQGSKSPNRIYAANFEDCKQIRIQNVSLINASYWTLRISDCEEVQILGIKIKSTSYFNNDGIDLDGRNIVVADCIIDAIDDGICLKSYNKEKSCENISITNCIISSNCNAIKLGTASEGGFKNIVISNCIIKRPSQNDYFDYKKYTIPGITENYSNNTGIALELVDGGGMEQIAISNITMLNTLTPIFIRLGERRNPPAGYMKDVTINNIIATCNSLMSCSITGIPGYYVKNVKISNVILNCPGGGMKEHTLREIPESINSYPENKIFGADLPAYGFYIRHASNIQLNNIQMNIPFTDNRFAIYMEDCRNVTLNQVISNTHKSSEAYLKVVNTKNLFVSGFNTEHNIPLFMEIAGTLPSTIKLTGNDFTEVKDLFHYDKVTPAPSIMHTGNFINRKNKRK